MSRTTHEKRLFIERVLMLAPESPKRTRKKPSSWGRTAIVTIYQPVRVGKDEWRCDFSVRTGGQEVSDRRFGVDGLQALEIALDSLHDLLTKTIPDASWLSGKPGDMGLPIVILGGVPFPEVEQLRSQLKTGASAFGQAYHERLVAERKKRKRGP